MVLYEQEASQTDPRLSVVRRPSSVLHRAESSIRSIHPKSLQFSTISSKSKAMIARYLEKAEASYSLPLLDLLHQAHEVHRAHHDPSDIQKCTLLSIKTGGCPEDCSYCPQ